MRDFKTVVSLAISLFVFSTFLIFVTYTTYVWILAPVSETGVCVVAEHGGACKGAGLAIGSADIWFIFVIYTDFI